jgi:DhnA family fructose-bisphosphate aldolase class Ia
MPSGKAVRLGRLFDRESGRSVIVAADHGIGGAPAGLEHFERAMAPIVAARPDALILTPGGARRAASMLGVRGAPALMVAVDAACGATLPGGPRRGETYRVHTTVEEALRLGADALKMLLIFGRESLEVHAENLYQVARAAHACEAWGVPLLVEPVVWGAAASDEERRSPRVLRHICRIAVESGADVLKVAYPGDPETFRSIVSELSVPVVILGGPRMESPREVVAAAAGAVTAGARGLAFGRNVFQATDPPALIHALRQVVHENVPVDRIEL